MSTRIHGEVGHDSVKTSPPDLREGLGEGESEGGSSLGPRVEGEVAVLCETWD